MQPEAHRLNSNGVVDCKRNATLSYKAEVAAANWRFRS